MAERDRGTIDYSQWKGASRLARFVAAAFNRLPGNSHLLAAAEDEFPDGLAAFHLAAWDAYQAGEWKWAQPASAATDRHLRWTNYVTFLHEGWYEDGLLAWKTTKWMDDPSFSSSYEAAIQQTGADYRIHWRTHVALWAARYALRVPGAYVEVGTGRGWMMSAILAGVLGDHPSRAVFLLDSFESIRVDPQTGERAQDVSPVYAHGVGDIAPLLETYPQVNAIVGDVFETAALAAQRCDRIAFVHFDLNAAAPEVHAFRELRSRFGPGTVVLLDDYGFVGFEAQRDAWDQMADEFDLTILCLPTGQGLFII